MQSLLTTMGILLAGYDEQRDFLANFEPFVIDRLCCWPVDEPVAAKKMSEELGRAFNLPPIPLNTVSDLITRVKKDGYLKSGRNGKPVPDLRKLKDVEGNVLEQRTEALAHFEAAGDALRLYASERFGLKWSAKQTDLALEGFVAEFGIEMAEARRRGGLGGNGSKPDQEAVSVVHGFARHCLERDPVHFNYLEEMVRGSMLTNVLYFRDLGNWSQKIENLVVFLDTPIALRLLGLAPEEMRLGAEELMDMLRKQNVPVRVFEHTIAEMMGVLDGVKGNLEMARRQQLDLNSFKNLNREVIEYLMGLGWGPGNLQEIMSNLDSQLARIDIGIEPTPPITRELSVADGRFEEILLGRQFTPSQVNMDIKSITAVYRLRGGKPARSLNRARALFVTPNLGLVRASAQFFREQGLQSPVGLCMADRSLATQLWLLDSSQGTKVARKTLIAESYAALDPPETVWRQYLDKIEARRQAGEVTDEQIKTLIFSGVAQESFFEITRNDPREISDQTPKQVLDRYEEVIREPAEIEARKREEELTKQRTENEALRELADSAGERAQRQEKELEKQRDQIEGLKSWQAEAAARRERRLRLARRVIGVAAAAIVLVGSATLLATNTVAGSFGFAIIVSLAVAFAFVLVGWGLQKPLRWSRDAVIAIGASLAFFFGVYGVAQSFMG